MQFSQGLMPLEPLLVTLVNATYPPVRRSKFYLISYPQTTFEQDFVLLPSKVNAGRDSTSHLQPHVPVSKT